MGIKSDDKTANLTVVFICMTGKFQSILLDIACITNRKLQI